MSERNLVIFVQ